MFTFFVLVCLGAKGDDVDPADEEEFEKSLITLYPQWESFTGVDYPNQMISGTLYIEFMWNTTTIFEGIERPDKIVDIKNFASGSSGIIRLEGVSAPEIQIRTAMTKYAGDFTQKYDKKCFPFDELVAQFYITLSPPGPLLFDFELVCSATHSEEMSSNVRAFGLDGTELYFS